MLGYVKVLKDELKVKEFDLFRAHYCGLCKTLKAEYGFASRMGLSYDLTFFALLLSSLQSEKEVVSPQICVANPFKKKPVVSSTDYLRYAAGANVLLTYFKILDDVRDNHSLKSILFLPFMLSAKRKAKKRYPKLFSEMKSCLSNLSALEKEKCSEPDKLADSFARLLGAIFDADVIDDEKNRRILKELGRLTGRYIYLLDAADDIEKDREKKTFNVLLNPDCPVSKSELLDSLEFTLSEVAAAYNLLEIKKNKNILDNIIYLGLADSLKKARCEKKENTND